MSKLLFPAIMLLMLAPAGLRGQELSTLVAQITEYNCLDYPNSIQSTKQYHNYKQLAEVATTDTLLLLTSDSNPVLACYAAWGLADRNYEDITSVFLRFLQDDKVMQVARGPILYSSSMARQLYEKYCSGDGWRTRLLDSIVLYTHHTSIEMLSLVLSYDHPERDLERIRFLAYKWNRVHALLYLYHHHTEDNDDEALHNGLVRYFNRSTVENMMRSNVLYEMVPILLSLKNYSVNNDLVAKLNGDTQWRTHSQDADKLSKAFEWYAVYGLR